MIIQLKFPLALGFGMTTKFQIMQQNDCRYTMWNFSTGKWNQAQKGPLQLDDKQER